MERSSIADIVLRYKWVIILTTIIAVVIALIATAFVKPVFSTSLRLRVLTASNSSGAREGYGYDVLYTDRLMRTIVQVANSRPILDEVARRLSTEANPQLQVEFEEIDNPPDFLVEALASSEVLVVTAEASNPLLAQRAANTLASILIERSDEIYSGVTVSTAQILQERLTQLESELALARKEYNSLQQSPTQNAQKIADLSVSIDSKQRLYSSVLANYENAHTLAILRSHAISLINAAEVPTRPARPNGILNMALGTSLGLVGGLGLAFLFESLDDRLHSMHIIEATSGLSIICKVPNTKPNRTLIFLNCDTFLEEIFRRLRVNLLVGSDTSSLRSYLVTSAEPGEGRTTFAANLAVAFANSGRATVLVDADLRLPTIHRLFDVCNDTGLGNVVAGQITPELAIQICRVSNLYILPSGAVSSNSPDLLDSSRMRKVIQTLEQQFDVVLLDSPACTAVTDPTILASSVGGVILVVRHDRTRRAMLQATCQQLTQLRANLVGIVITRTRESYPHFPWYRQYQRFIKKNEPRTLPTQPDLPVDNLSTQQEWQTLADRQEQESSASNGNAVSDSSSAPPSASSKNVQMSGANSHSRVQHSLP